MRLLWTLQSLVLKTSKDGDSTTSLENLLQCLTVLTVQTFFPISRPSLHYFNLC